ncbi:MAG: hypothetical protein GW762_02465 [Candidatus Pacebacteria bacterium]|nr:hypothetical protein [Candidatus Paceibacterota bacterium]
MHFSIRIPSGWRVVEQENRVGFGPKEVGEDVLVAIQTYPKNEKSLAEISDEFGKQFSDRVQESNTIAVNGLVATEVITTTPSYEDWYYRSVIIIKDDVIYVFSNGAITDSSIQGFRGVPVDYTFEKFIQSFHIIP